MIEASDTAILLVEDDAETRHQVASLLERHGYQVAEAADAESALGQFAAGAPDLILLDLGLPDRDGLVVVDRVRAAGTTPILVLSARDREADKVAALEAGADDYLAKPYGMAELQARIGAILRRADPAGAEPDESGIVRIGELELDPASHSVRVAGSPVRLTPLEFRVLQVLAERAGQLVTYGRLLRAVWGAAYDDEAHYVHVYVGQIRRKLSRADPDGRLAGLIVPEPGVGYRVRAGTDPRPS
ncbi:MAG TPA: response regulator transcription factor [Candidatus Limnocylindrales bacterium]|nr:response regulator transcription factor [Candidatus Limnocylindrales bacterium]